MKKSTKTLLLLFLIWCGLHLLLSFVSLLDIGSDFFEEIFWYFYPITDNSFDSYTLEEPIIYIGLPVFIYWIWTKIVENNEKVEVKN